MEVSISGSQGFSPDHVVLVRAGQVRRQAKLGASAKLQFPSLPVNASPLQVEVFEPLGSKTVSLSEDAESYCVRMPPPPAGTSCSSLRLRVQERALVHASEDQKPLAPESAEAEAVAARATGSTLSHLSSDKESTPSTTFSPLPTYISFTPSSPAVSPHPSVPYLLPSVNTVCPDVPTTFSNAPTRGSIIAKNPLYPVTLPMIMDLVAEDEKMFGHLPVLKSLPMEVLMASPRLEERTSPCPSPAPLNLTITASCAVSVRPSSPPPCRTLYSPTPSSTYSSMTNSSLPPRKRKIVVDEDLSCRGSVIQYAH